MQDKLKEELLCIGRGIITSMQSLNKKQKITLSKVLEIEQKLKIIKKQKEMTDLKKIRVESTLSKDKTRY